MAKIINPQIEVKIFSSYGDFTFSEEDISIYIEKDLDEEPNTAEIKIQNLAPDNRFALVESSNESAPVEIRLTQWGTTDLVLAFRGEIGRVRNRDNFPEPGIVTEIYASSQKINKRNFYVSEKAFPKGTSYSAVILWLADQVGLPKEYTSLPTGVLKKGRSFSGTSFGLLKEYLNDFGYYAYITDGVLHMTDRYSPMTTTPTILDSGLMYSEPENMSLDDYEEIEIRTIRMNKKGDIKKKKKNVKLVGPSDYISESIDDFQIEGRIYNFPALPQMNPDELISVRDETSRIQTVIHDCDNMHNSGYWHTTVESILDIGVL